MTRHQHRVAATATAVASIALGLLLAAPARGASLTEVARATWGATGVPSYVQMYIYVPDKLATKPPIMVSAHSCGSTATGQMGNIPKIKAAADANGFILILPDNPGQNCWDVGSTQALKHDGGGDTQAIAQMVKYTLTKYNGDAARVYIMGGSSGAMLTQAMLAVYPDVFRAGSARAGVAAGCWADGYASSNQWSNNCAGGNTTKTAQQWGDLVRNMYPGYTGHRPRVQIMQGTADTTISYKNTAESVKEWTNVLGLSTTPTSSDSGFKAANATYNRELWKNACGYTVLEAWSSPNGTHSMPYEEADVLKFFGLDTAGGSDPEPTCSGDGGVGGANGAAGASGSGGTTGAGGARDGGVDAGAVTGMAGRGGGSGSGDSGAAGSGGGAGTGNAGGSGGTGAMGGNNATAGTGGSAVITGAAGTGSVSSGGRGGQSNGGTTGIAGAAGPGGSPGGGGSGTPGDGPSDGGGCDGCFIGGDAGRPAPTLAVVVVAALGLVLRRQRRRRF